MKIALIGPSGCGKTTQLELRYGSEKDRSMDLGLVFNPLPTATKMLDWIRNAPPDIVSVSVHHEGLIELAEMKTKFPHALTDIYFIYLHTDRAVLCERLFRREGSDHKMPSSELMDAFPRIANHTIDTTRLQAEEVRSKIDDALRLEQQRKSTTSP